MGKKVRARVRQTALLVLHFS